LAGIIADDDGITQEAVGMNAAPQLDRQSADA
jgi:hypothetical protein